MKDGVSRLNGGQGLSWGNCPRGREDRDLADTGKDGVIRSRRRREGQGRIEWPEVVP